MTRHRWGDPDTFEHETEHQRLLCDMVKVALHE